MKDFTFLNKIFNYSPNIEAVICLSKDGFPLQWRIHNMHSIEEITSIAASLFSAGHEYALLSHNSHSTLSITTNHGKMVVFELSKGILLLLLFVGETHAGIIQKVIQIAQKNAIDTQCNDYEKYENI